MHHQMNSDDVNTIDELLIFRRFRVSNIKNHVWSCRDNVSR